ncbi:lytic polysaccharide monooxygenase [Periconia macrospinosa]|uniref:AA9 family lytic polysaccharide monooxygenase n=1 Tax=Periconia macrospinosa TaxID=97972 RepID=A0A2V1DR61_9PLEO|nr:lytic polysaccharide monooxygenase [Periconia macrospinosa]
MKSVTVLLASFALLAPTNAHYFFSRLILDGKWTSTWEYVREISPYPGDTTKLAMAYPNTDPDSPDLRCGRNATIGWSQPKTATVKAGDTIGFGAAEYELVEVPRMYHPGVASAWLSKVTGDLNQYLGDGEWVKIMQTREREAQSVDFTKEENKLLYNQMKSLWATFQADSWNFTIPATAPSGRYLLRYEHMFPNPQDTQFYVNCANIEVVNEGTEGAFPAGVKIPGVYTRGQKDVYFSTYDYGLKGSLDGYKTPAPEPWKG